MYIHHEELTNWIQRFGIVTRQAADIPLFYVETRFGDHFVPGFALVDKTGKPLPETSRYKVVGHVGNLAQFDEGYVFVPVNDMPLLDKAGIGWAVENALDAAQWRRQEVKYVPAVTLQQYIAALAFA